MRLAKSLHSSAWEWGTALRNSGDLVGAAKVHRLASESFDDIGDKVRTRAFRALFFAFFLDALKRVF
jgi:hypothetical protein